MAYEFKRLSDVEALTEVPEGANALIEVDGSIKRVPGSGLGGSTGIKTAIIKDSGYDSAIAGVQTMVSASPTYTYECLNMTFEEAYEALANCEPFTVFLMTTNGIATSGYCDAVLFFGTSEYGIPCIGIMSDQELYWTADGISTEAPEQPK